MFTSNTRYMDRRIDRRACRRFELRARRRIGRRACSRVYRGTYRRMDGRTIGPGGAGRVLATRGYGRLTRYPMNDPSALAYPHWCKEL